MSDPDSLDLAAQTRLIDTLQELKVPNVGQAVMAASRQVGGKGIIGRFMRATRGPGKISIHEYIYYRMFDPVLVPEAEIDRFVGGKVRIRQMLSSSDGGWGAPAYDKVLWDMIMGAAGLPKPGLKAVFGTGRPAADVAYLQDTAALEAFLGDPANYPMLAKPNNAGRSLGVISMQSLDGGNIVLHDGTARPIGDVVSFITGFLGGQYLFQELLQPHPAIARLTGGSLATLRVMLLYGPGKAEIENITLKLPAAGALADNYWRDGNMLGAVDADGAVRRVVTGNGLELKELPAHPGTGESLEVLTLPDMEAIRDFCTNAAPYFHGIRFQAWDIALTDRGPVPVEVNFRGDVNLQQLAHGRGAMTPAYCEHLRECGYKGKLPA